MICRKENVCGWEKRYEKIKITIGILGVLIGLYWLIGSIFFNTQISKLGMASVLGIFIAHNFDVIASGMRGVKG